MVVFPFSEFWGFYLGFSLFVGLMLALDLGVFHRKAHEVSVKEAGAWTVAWLTLALVFNGLLYVYCLNKFGEGSEGLARKIALEFLSGYVVEKSLAIDNLFVFAIIFSYFTIPKAMQHRVLFYGILGALVFRAVFIAIGTQLMAYQAVVIFFGGLLVFTGVKMLFSPSQAMEPERSWILRLIQKFISVDPKASPTTFFVSKKGVRHATPLFLALIFIELTDILFAVDSVPAIFALTQEPLIVFTSNIFAILGLRSMYFLLAGALNRFQYIKYGLSGVLIFVGLKMAWLNELFGGKFPISWSLGIIALLIGGSMGYSFYKSRGATGSADSTVSHS